MFFAFLEFFSQSFALFVITPLVLIVGFYLTCRLRFLQLTKLNLGLSSLLKGEAESQGDISHFQAIATVLAGNLGTGNISGMAVALTTGGPGSIVWMWLMAFFGAILKYTGCLLGVKYRQRNSEGEYVGGPMYYLEKGLGMRKAAILFCLFAIATAFTVGNIVQVNSVTLPLEAVGWPPLLVGLGTALAAAVVIIGGHSRFAHVAAALVPAMAGIYLAVACLVLVLHIEKLPEAAALMFEAAFDFSAVGGGVLGYAVFRAMAVGFERGVFATDAGVGIAPILQASARTKSAVVEGAVAMVAPLVVMVISTITGLVLIVTGAWKIEGLRSTLMCTWAFGNGLGSIGGAYLVVFSLVLFAYTTILAWSYCGERAVEYLWGLKYVRLFQYLYVAAIPVGALVHVEMAWQMADICMGGMLMVNLFALLMLFPVVQKESSLFFRWKS